MSRLVRVAPGVRVATSRRDTMNSVVVTADGTDAPGPVLLVDPGWDPDELDALAAELASVGDTVTAGLSTHAHYDHLLWHPDFGDAPRYGSAATARLAVDERPGLLEGLGDGYSDALLDVFAKVTPLPGPELPWSGLPVEAIIHDAHAPGHTAAWLPGSRVLIAGDLLSDVELPLPDDDDPGLERYAAGLDALAAYAVDAALVIPGHGHPTTDGRARLDADRRYLDDVLSSRATDDPRLANPGMRDAHAETLARVAGSR